jgi:hypothetical protein
MKLLRRKRDSSAGYTVSLYRTETGYRVTLSDSTSSHRERVDTADLAEANRVARDFWDTARDSFDTDPWPTVR